MKKGSKKILCLFMAMGLILSINIVTIMAQTVETYTYGDYKKNEDVNENSIEVGIITEPSAVIERENNSINPENEIVITEYIEGEAEKEIEVGAYEIRTNTN